MKLKRGLAMWLVALTLWSVAAPVRAHRDENQEITDGVIVFGATLGGLLVVGGVAYALVKWATRHDSVDAGRGGNGLLPVTMYPEGRAAAATPGFGAQCPQRSAESFTWVCW